MSADGLLNEQERSEARELLDCLLEEEGIHLSHEEGIVPRKPGSSLPLSFAQERLWFLEQLQPETSVYNLPLVMRASGALQVETLQRSLSEIVRRHEVLRTRFMMGEGGPVQVIDPAGVVPLPVLDVSGLEEEQREKRAVELSEEEAQRPFDLSRGPLLRALLIKLGAEEHLLVVNQHHVVSDGWSLAVLWRELGDLYAAYARGEESPLPELAVQYADYAIWQREWLRGEVLEQELGFWKKQLERIPEALELPTDRPRPEMQGVKGAIHVFSMSVDRMEQLKYFARCENVTLFMVLLAGLQVLLARYSGQHNFAVGTPHANRDSVEVEGLIGFFINMLVLPSDVAGNPTFRELLARVRQRTLEVFAHHVLPFERLIEELGVDRNLSRTPLFQVGFALQNTAQPAMQFGGLQFRSTPVNIGASKYDLSIFMAEGAAGLGAMVEYSSELFDEQTISTLVRHFEVLLTSAVAHPRDAVRQLRLISPDEAQMLECDRGGISAGAVPRTTLVEMVAVHAAQTPAQIALIAGEKKITYAELERQTNRLARYLRRRGLRRGAAAGICLEHAPDLLSAILAVMKAGGVAVPVGSDEPEHRMLRILRSAGAQMVIASSLLLDRLQKADAEIVCPDRKQDRADLEGESSEELNDGPDPESPACILYGSSWTGAPEGVLLQHRSLIANRGGPEINATDRVAHRFHLAAELVSLEVFRSLGAGACIVDFPEHSLSPRKLGDIVRKNSVTVLNASVATLEKFAGDFRHAMKTVRLALCPEKRQLLQRLREMLDDDPQLQDCVYSVAGIAEIGGYWELIRLAERETRRLVSPKQLVPGCRLYVLDEYMEPSPEGVVGEVYVGSAALALAYQGSPALTAETFLPDPFSDMEGGRLYRSGELARLRAAGMVELLGNKTGRTLLHGVRLDPAEVEQALAEYPGVREAAIAFQEHSKTHRLELVAFIAADSGWSGLEQLKVFLAERLPKPLRPERYVRVDETPRSADGQVDRRALLRSLERSQENGDAPFAAPTNEVEQKISAIWCRILRLEKVSIFDNFFRLGGHSLLATQVMVQLQTSFGVEIPVRALFESSTIKDLAQRVEAELKKGISTTAPAITRRERKGPVPLSFAQERLWFLDQLQPGAATYNLPIGVRLSGLLDATSLQRSLSEIVRRHEVLRTRFMMGEGGPVQVIDPAGAVPLPVLDVSGLEEEQREKRAVELSEEEAQRPFDLSRGPLLRALLIKLGAEEHLLVVNQHHIVSDGWSVAVLWRELGELYAAYARGEESPLPELAVQYADYAIWQREWLRGEVLEQELGFWKKQLERIPEALELPTDRPRPEMQSSRGTTLWFRFSAELGQGLKALADRENASLFMLLFAGFQVLLARYSGQTNFALGTSIANRNRANIEGLAGFFINTLVLCSDVQGNPGFVELLSRVRNRTLDAYAHENLPFEKLVDELQLQRDLSRQPLFQVAVVMQNIDQPAMELGGLSLRGVTLKTETTKYDLTLFLAEDPTGLLGIMEYSTEVFDEATMLRLSERYRTLLEGVVAHPESPIAFLPILSASEAGQALAVWNHTESEAPTGISFGELADLERVETLALVSGGEKLSYGELERRVSRLANRLRGSGVKAGDRVAICLDRVPGFLVAALAVLKLGGVFIPLDPRDPSRRIAFILTDCKASRIIGEQRLEHLFAASQTPLVQIEEQGTEWELSKDDEEKRLEVSPDVPACIFYRSGAEGRPRGIVLPAAALWKNGLIKETEPVALRLDLAHEMTPLLLFSAIAAGSCVVDITGLPPRRLAENLRNQAARVLVISAPLLQRLAAEFPRSLNQVRLIVCEEGRGTLQKLRAELPPEIVERVFGLYGTTEAGGACMMYPIAELNARDLPVRQLTAQGLYVMDEMLNPVGEGMVGEICISGRTLALCFDTDPGATAASFLPDPLSDIAGARLYRTGQLVCFRTAGLELRKRRDRVIEIDGMRLGLKEIEAALSESPELSSSVVVAREPSSPGNPVLTAYVVAKEGHAASQETLKEFLKERLPGYMVPSQIVFSASLPRTAQGEFDMRALSSGSSESGSSANAPQKYVPPGNPVEESLAKIWAEIFGLDRVGIHDNFFALGGDSILSILAVTRASRAGIQITARQMFERQTIAGLASVAGRTESVAAEQGLVSGLVPLTPAQLWFFEQNFHDQHHFNQAVILATRERIDPDLLKQVAATILAQHDALRMRFTRSTHEWRQETVANEDVERVFAHVKLKAADELVQAAGEWQASLDLQAGPLIRIVLFELGQERSQRVLIVIHHLVVDGVSWRILLEDLERGYGQAKSGNSLDLGAKTSSFQQWARQLEQFAQSKELGQQTQYWQKIPAASLSPLPRDRQGVDNTVSSAATVTVSIGREQTRALLQETTQTYRMQMNEVLLGGFALAMREWMGSDTLRLDLEGHGREEIIRNVDVTRTVGWFTAIFPVVLQLTAAAEPGTVLKHVKEQLRRTPDRGLSYGLLRFLKKDPTLPQSSAEVIFNYLGQFDRVLEEEGIFQGAAESTGPLQSARASRSYVLEVNAAVQEGRLQAVCTYSTNLHERRTIETLMNSFVTNLEILIDHCRHAAWGGYTPSDFPMVQLSQQFLDSLPQANREIESIFPLVSMQEDMLVQTLKAPDTGVYFEQLVFRVKGLRPEEFRLAWQRVVDRHACLRALYAWESLERPVQIVRQHAEIGLEREDWKEADNAGEDLLNEFLLRDRARGFDLTRPPLMRLTHIHSEQADWIVWSFHHILLDGWSGPILMQEVFNSYQAICQGHEPQLPHPADYEAYVRWRRGQNQEELENFWRVQLQDFPRPAPLGVETRRETGSPTDIGRETVQFSHDVVKTLESFARERQLTLNTVVQGMWSLLLCAYTGDPEVVFGAWGSGRSADVAEIERIVGALINTLPVRVRVDEDVDLIACLKKIQDQQLEQRQYEHVDLNQLAEWSGTPRGSRMFHTILVFENYPVAASLGNDITESGMQIFDVKAREQTHYPIAVRIMPRDNLTLLLEYDQKLYGKQTATQILANFQQLLTTIAAKPNCRTKDLLGLVRPGPSS